MNGLWLAGAAMEAIYLLVFHLGDLHPHVPLFISLYGILFILFIGLWRRLRQEPLTRLQTRALIAFAVLFRLTLLLAPISLSDDIYRYIWEGRVQRFGQSPFEYAPSAPELAVLRDELYPLINHKDIPTIYPPLTQGVFRVGSYLSDFLEGVMPLASARVFSQRGLFLLFDFLTLWVLLKFLRQRGLPDSRLLLYAWNPLVIVEFAGSGHNDSLGIFYLISALWAWEQRREGWSSLSLAASFLSKYLSIVLIPYLLFRKRWTMVGFFSLIALIGAIPFCACWLMTQGVQHYVANWQFNASVYALLSGTLRNPAAAKITTAVLMGASMVWIGRTEDDLTRVSFWLIALSLLLAPTVHPWYFIWLIPFLCVFPDPSFLIWNGTIILSYSVLDRYARFHTWDLHPAMQILEYAPVFLMLGWEGFYGWRTRNSV